MRKTLTALALFGLLLAACGTSQPGKPAPTVLGTQAPGQATEAPPMPHY
jgi:nitrous oxide reductase accessory protein NosL